MLEDEIVYGEYKERKERWVEDGFLENNNLKRGVYEVNLKEIGIGWGRIRSLCYDGGYKIRVLRKSNNIICFNYKFRTIFIGIDDDF